MRATTHHEGSDIMRIYPHYANGRYNIKVQLSSGKEYIAVNCKTEEELLIKLGEVVKNNKDNG